MAVGIPHADAPSCIRIARSNMFRVKQLLSEPREGNGEESAALLREAEIQLGCACAIYSKLGTRPDPAIQSTLQELQGEIAVLAHFFQAADKLLAGWLQAIGSRQSGYTTQGQAAPLVLVKKVSVEG